MNADDYVVNHYTSCIMSSNKGLQRELSVSYTEKDNWVESQQRVCPTEKTSTHAQVFAKWLNHTINDDKYVVKDLVADLKDGTILGKLMESVTRQPLPYNNVPGKKESAFHIINRINTMIAYMKTEGLKLTCAAEGRFHGLQLTHT